MRSATYRISQDGGEKTLTLSGDWTSLTLGDEAIHLQSEVGNAGGIKLIDLSQLGRIDTAGAYVIMKAAGSAIPYDTAARPELARLFDLVRPAVEEEIVPPKSQSWLVQFFDKIGRGLAYFADEAAGTADFLGRAVMALARTIRSPGRLRGISLVRAMETAGTDALPIIVLMNFFIGAVVALVGANLLASFGASLFTVQLVGVAVLREFAILFTGILLAGRSASSFAAQIGSMKMTQETDAMKVMGVDQFDALVVPRVLALVLMMPLLALAAMFAGIAGGLLVSWAMIDIDPFFFLEQLRETVSIRHFWIGMSKAPLLAMLIALAGCRHGFAVAGDVESLGERVTQAVVQAIFMIILFDAIFAIVYMELHL